MELFPQVGVNQKNIWNHHLVMPFTRKLGENMWKQLHPIAQLQSIHDCSGNTKVVSPRCEKKLDLP